MAPARGSYILVLHAHVPFVLGHGRWPHGSDWLTEAAIGSYLPLVGALGRALAPGERAAVTIDLSPILCEQMAHPSFQSEVDEFLRRRLEFAAENRAHFERSGEGDLADLTGFWERVYAQTLEQFGALDGDLLRAFGLLAESGRAELVTTAATHGYLPLLGREESVDLQLRAARDAHRRHFGTPPEGAWLPECGYRPRYEWTPPAGPQAGKVRRRRRGIEESLADLGLGCFVTDAHLLRGGEALPAHRDYYPTPRAAAAGAEHPPHRRMERSLGTSYVVASRGGGGTAVAFVRDPAVSQQVWSRESGYPGGPWYLEFHKKHFPGGIRYWRVTDPRGGLGSKAAYDPVRALEAATGDAARYAEVIGRTLDAETPRLAGAAQACAPFDAELFGHWWFEGPTFLEELLRLLPSQGITAESMGRARESHPPGDRVGLLEGSWGEGGDHRVWLNRETEWTWDLAYAAEEEFWAAAAPGTWEAHPFLRRVVAQMARELLLMQSSDWQFLITTWAARNYAESRFAEHHAHFNRLRDTQNRIARGYPVQREDEEFLAGREAQDFAFPDVLDHVAEAREVKST